MPDQPDAIMIFAAGFGTRMMPLTNDKPKPMVHVGGRPMIDRARDLAQAAGFSRIVSNAHYKADVLKAHLRETNVVVVHEQPDILDTGGGLRHALPTLGPGPVATLNPDAIWHGPNPLTLALNTWNPDRMDALLVCVPPQQVRGRQGEGDFEMDPQGRLTRGQGLVYGGAQILKTSLLQDIEDDVFSLNVVWDVMIAQGRCFGCVYPGAWCDVGHPDGIKDAEAMIGYAEHD